MEVWKDIQGHENYMISNTGKIWFKETYVELIEGKEIIKGQYVKTYKGSNERELVKLFTDGHWREYYVDTLKGNENVYDTVKRKDRIKIRVFNNEGFNKIYNSINEAAKELNVAQGNSSNVVNGKINSIGGYKAERVF